MQLFGAADIAKNKHFHFNLFTISYFLTVETVTSRFNGAALSQRSRKAL
ncbi:hypothetical protein NAL19_1282 [Pectobacterium sp. F1-1]|nr:hypothetical protein NAL19_1282 [Pectobacterium sp. F1-1]